MQLSEAANFFPGPKSPHFSLDRVFENVVKTFTS
jgi:hypothetical protein